MVSGKWMNTLVGAHRIRAICPTCRGKDLQPGTRGEEQVSLNDCTSAEPLVGVEAELGPRGWPWAKCSWQCPVGTSSLARISQ